MYVRVWDVPRQGLRTAWRWLATVLAISLTVLLISLTDRVVEGLPLGNLLDLAIAFSLWTIVWTVVPGALMGRQVPYRSLWATGLVTAAAIALVSVAGAVYLPIALSSGARQFGAIGVSIAYIGWLFVLGFAVVVAAVVGHAAALDEGRLGVLVRGSQPPPIR
jgi:membrane protein